MYIKLIQDTKIVCLGSEIHILKLLIRYVCLFVLTDTKAVSNALVDQVGNATNKQR